jgi:hypothetical protein
VPDVAGIVAAISSHVPRGKRLRIRGSSINERRFSARRGESDFGGLSARRATARPCAMRISQALLWAIEPEAIYRYDSQETKAEDRNY